MANALAKRQLEDFEDEETKGFKAWAKARVKGVLDELIPDARRYFPKAILLAALLTLIGNNVAALPTEALPLVFLLYAAPVMIAAIYKVSVNRFYNRYRYNDDGWLAERNRTWTGWMCLSFALALVSAFSFALDAPVWDGIEWALIWGAVPVYFIVFQISQHVWKKQYAKGFYKSRSIVCSAAIVAIPLCLIYALIALSVSPGDVADSVRETLDNYPRALENSSCILLREVDKLNSFINALTGYQLNRVMDSSSVGILVMKAFLVASVFFGFATQLGCCVLTREEIKSEFQPLPASKNETDTENSLPIRKKYFACLAAVWIALSAAFLGVNYEVEKIAEEQGAITEIDRIIEEIGKWAVLADEEDPDELIKNEETQDKLDNLSEAQAEERKRLAIQYESEIETAINDYYNSCLENVDSYVRWHSSPFSLPAKTFGLEGTAIDEFEARVVSPVDSESSPIAAYESYRNQLQKIENDYRQEYEKIDPRIPSGEPTIPKLELWPDWNTEEGAKIAEDVLLKPKKKPIEISVKNFIEERRQEALNRLQEMNSDEG